jgi:hypothetical protein
MGILLDLLRAAKGEAPTESPLGRWRKKVSQALDSGAGAPADYINSKNLSAQTLVDNPDNIAVETDINVRGITRPDAFSFQLTPGKTYHMVFHARFTDFTDPVTGRLSIRWVDDAGTFVPDPATGPDPSPAEFYPLTSTDPKTSDPTAEVIYTVPASPASASIVKVHCVASTGTATLPSNGSSVTIVEIK